MLTRVVYRSRAGKREASIRTERQPSMLVINTSYIGKRGASILIGVLFGKKAREKEAYILTESQPSISERERDSLPF